jgi:hypothetical protein
MTTKRVKLTTGMLQQTYNLEHYPVSKNKIERLILANAISIVNTIYYQKIVKWRKRGLIIYK